MADLDKTLITRADIDMTSTPTNGRNRIDFDGVTLDTGSFTGIRDITGLLMPGQVTSGRLLVARKDFQVFWVFDNLVLPAASSGLSWQILDGPTLQSFRPFYRSTMDFKAASDGHVFRLAVTPDADVFVQFAMPARAISTVFETFTQAGWPSVLPGVADGEPVVI